MGLQALARYNCGGYHAIYYDNTRNSMFCNCCHTSKIFLFALAVNKAETSKFL